MRTAQVRALRASQPPLEAPQPKPRPGSLASASGADASRVVALLCRFLAEPLCTGLLFCKMTSDLCPKDHPPHGDPLLPPHKVARQRRAHRPRGQEGSTVLLLLSWGPVHPRTLWRTLTLTVSCPHSCPRAPGAPPAREPSRRVGREPGSAPGHGHTGWPAALWCLLRRGDDGIANFSAAAGGMGSAIRERQPQDGDNLTTGLLCGAWEVPAGGSPAVRETPRPARKTHKRPLGDTELLGRKVGKAFFFFNEAAYSVTKGDRYL